ncbi:UDP-glucoronosyl and UDP-glucosyl transferase [Musa troglodytarum]|uniref:Glycosyltransferase n=1 Tax=Musa troglodytarum TaxID=320322 RepID=A0A9E7HM52_9LILI|nr:UDP-glucoronosyl and UDP-glucosyl transferase [Musa troglodytarum]
MAVCHRKPPHALLVPYPLQGHIVPAVHLATKLASRGFTITFVYTEAIHHQTSRAASGVDRDIFAAARAWGLDVRCELVNDGLPVAFDRSLNHDRFMGSLLHVLPAHVEELMRKLSLHADPPVTCLIADTFFVWPSTLAKKFGLPYVSFWTEPALVFTLYYHLDLLIKHGHFASHDNSEDTITYVPGVAAIEPADLMSYLQERDVSSLEHQIIFRAFEEAKGADLVLCNTVQELEPETISALQLEKPFYAIGPIFPAGFTKSAVATSLWAESDCSRWLDSKPPGSILYISFGSYAHISRRDLKEIAHGVLRSKARFLWVLRPDVVSSDDPDPLPESFIEDSKGRGMVVPWCCQTAVLSHRSIGAFLTHCGWNSILESVWCGVPLLCFPLLTDQFTNRKLVVQDWRIGLDLGEKNKVGRKEVAEGIESVMGEVGDELREKVKDVRRTLERALGPQGSSQTNLDRFIADLMQHGPQLDGARESTLRH